MNNYYSSLNIVLKRSEEGIHNDKERYQNLEDSIHLDNAIKAKLEEFQIPYIEVDVNKNTVNKILELIGQ
jgi:cystathionine beta-lyase family protein involved in aluminum resistance